MCQHEALHAELVNQGPAVHYVRQAHSFTFIGENAAALFGMSAQDVLANSNYWLDHLHPDDRATVLTRLASLAPNRPLCLEYRFLDAKGGVVWMSDEMVMAPGDGKNRRVLGAVRNITEQKRSEKALLESEKRYRRVSENVRDLVMQVDLRGVAYYASPSHRDVLGIGVDDMVGRNAYELVHPDDMGTILPVIREAIEERCPAKFEYRSRHADGHYLWTEANANPLIEDDGRVSGAILVTRDITEKKAAEEALRQARDELEEKVQERTRELLHANHELEDLNTALKVLLSQREKDKANLEENIMANVGGLILPYLEKLKRGTHDERMRACLATIEANLHDIVSSFSRQLASRYSMLTPREIQIASLIKEGRNSKEIADLLNLSLPTIEFHRNNLRKKLNIRNKKANLRSCLLAIK